jgi:hypothetical protein
MSMIMSIHPRAAYGERKTAQPDGNARPAGFSCEEVQTM